MVQMPHKYVWIAPKNKSECELVNKLNLANMYEFSEGEFAYLRNSKIEIRPILLISKSESLLEYAKILELLQCGEIFLIVEQSYIESNYSSIKDVFKKHKFQFYCLVNKTLGFEAKSDLKYFTSELDIYFNIHEIDFFWPDLCFTEEKFLRFCRKHPQRKIFPLPIPLYNSDACVQTCFSEIGTVLLDGKNIKTELSIIIPHYDNTENLILSLFNLSHEISKLRFTVELIIIDDGSPNFSILNEIQQLEFSNIKILQMPRSKSREMGDCAYRAGLARNFGVEHANSEKLLFLDCDILIDCELISNIIQQLGIFDLIMPERLQLKDSIKKKYEQIDPDLDINFQSSPYWKHFYETTKDWNSLKDKWKYVSTYCLAITRANFYKIGPFSCSFVCYGCEDVDLGYKANKLNFQFHLIKKNVFHIQPKIKRSEYEFNAIKRRKILLQSYYYLYLNHFESDIYDTLIADHIDYVEQSLNLT
jgi:hypothetical protein